MKRQALIALVPLLLAALAVAAAPKHVEPKGPKLAHMVFFTLKDRTKGAREAMAAHCHKYLSGHDGVLYFSVGTIAEDVVEPVSDRDFDIALHLVFDSKESELKYIDAPRHKEFVAGGRAMWSRVRVFDSYLTEPK